MLTAVSTIRTPKPPSPAEIRTLVGVVEVVVLAALPEHLGDSVDCMLAYSPRP